jgi:phenylacetate-CoA ligase
MSIKGSLYDLMLFALNKNSNDEYSQISGLRNKDQLNIFVEKRLKQLLLHTNTHTKYYRQIFDKIDLIKGETVDLSRFSEIPILTKKIMRRHHNDLISDEYQTRKWFYNSSGGSTGEPIQFIQDNIYWKWATATNYFYYKNILNIEEPTVKKIVLWGSERDLFDGSVGYKLKFSNWLTNTIFLNSFRMADHDIEEYIRIINSSKPELIRGYAGSLYELCRYAEKKKIPLYRPKNIVSAAENLTDIMRNVIKSNLGTNLYNFYGSREVGALALECKDGLLHTFPFWNYLEVLGKDDRPVQEGEEGRVVVTNLCNYSMPLIRYEIGDMAILGPEKCTCGQFLPTLKNVTGRITEHFLLSNGTTVPAEFFIHLLGVVYYDEGGFQKFQVIQEDYDKIRINVVSHNEILDQYKTKIAEKIRVVMGPECKITWNHIDDIPKTQSGKYQYTRSLMWS